MIEKILEECKARNATGVVAIGQVIVDLYTKEHRMMNVYNMKSQLRTAMCVMGGTRAKRTVLDEITQGLVEPENNIYPMSSTVGDERAYSDLLEPEPDIHGSGTVCSGSGSYSSEDGDQCVEASSDEEGCASCGEAHHGEAKRPKTATTLERKMGISSTPRYQPGRRKFADGGENSRGLSAGGQGGYQQHTYRYKKTGSKTALATVAQRLQKVNLDTAVTQFQKMGQFTGDYGAFPLSHSVYTSTQKRLLPLYLMDLTHLAEVGQGPLHRAYIWTTGGGDGKLGWEVQAGTNKIGTSTNVPFYKYATPGYQVATYHDKLHFGLMKIKLNLYGQTNRPTKITLQLVQFNSDDYTPVSDDGQSTQTAGANQIGNAFWQPQYKALVGNPIADQVRSRVKAMKVLRTATYNIGPTSTTENDHDPHCITVVWNHYHNRIVNMKKFQPVFTDDVDAVNPSKPGGDVAVNEAKVTPFAKDRVYLLIKSTAWTQLTDPATHDATNSASFEINCQTTVRCDD